MPDLPLTGPTVHRTDFRDFPALEVFTRNLRWMAAIASVNGISILFLTQGTMYASATPEEGAARFRMVNDLYSRGMPAPDVPTLEAGMRAFNAVSLAPAELPGVETFDLASALPATWEMFYDDCHYTPAGNRRIAELITPRIEGILERGSGGIGTGAASRP